jgi:predicted GH43/DUF377 family glycosyl hydrolase
MKRWRKLGLIFRPDTSRPWMQSHASAPVPVLLRSGLWRVYFASRDSRNLSHVGYFDIDLAKPEQVVAVAQNPVLAPGPLGHFDDHGIYASSAVRSDDRIYLYTAGWNPGSRTPLFYSSIGLAVSDDDGKTFVKHGSAPLLARSEYDPCLVTSPFVLREHDRWRMWYVSGVKWEDSSDRLKSYYHVKYAESQNGIEWDRRGKVAIDFASPEETNISRAWLVREQTGYQAWFASTRGAGYRIGVAVSPDGLAFERRDAEAGIDISDAGWENESIAYPAVIRHGDSWFMFYNGNGFGRDGIALATASV